MSTEKLLAEIAYQTSKKKTMHVLHLLLSLVTSGLWLPVWWLCARSNRKKNEALREALSEG